MKSLYLFAWPNFLFKIRPYKAGPAPPPRLAPGGHAPPAPPRYATAIGLGATSNVPAAFRFCRLVYFHSKFPYVSEFVKQMTDMLS